MLNSVPVTDTNKIRRSPRRAVYDRETVYAILDEVPICHMGIVDQHRPVVMPMLHWRKDDTLYIHGASNGRLMCGGEGAPVCVTVTAFDGFVLARSAFNHSANYRSVVIHGRAEPITGQEVKTALLKHFMELHFPGRWQQLRPMTEKELHATSILKLPLDQVSAKVRAEGAGDEKDDPDWCVWTGVLPVVSSQLAPIPDPAARYLPLPGYLKSDC